MEKFVDRIIETAGMTHGWPRSHKIRWPRCDARYA